MEPSFGAHFAADHNRTASFNKANDYATHMTFKPENESPEVEEKRSF